MIFFYGTSSRESETRLANPCGNCRQPALVQSDWHRYFHIMFIPTFPVGKRRVIHCGACNNSYETKASTALWTFIGSAILVTCALIGVGRQALKHYNPEASAANLTAAAGTASASAAIPSASAAPSTPPRAAAPRPVVAGAASHAAAPTTTRDGGLPAVAASAARRHH